jgi:RNA polymerase sigma-70 factor (ECF subfamily)
MNPSPTPTLLELPDGELAHRIAGGDEAALRRLMRRHNQSLFRAARSILRDEAEAEDAVQEGYLQAYRAMGTFRGDAKLSTWLMRIVVNEALGRSRRTKRGAEVIAIDSGAQALAAEETMSDNPENQPERLAARAQTRRLIEAKIDALPDQYRAVFVLRAVEEMTVEEVAQTLSIPEATVRTRFFRARALLRESMAHEVDLAVQEAFSFAGERCDRITDRVVARVAALRAMRT